MLELLAHGAKTDTAAAQLDHVCRHIQAGKKADVLQLHQCTPTCEKAAKGSWRQ